MSVDTFWKTTEDHGVINSICTSHQLRIANVQFWFLAYPQCCISMSFKATPNEILVSHPAKRMRVGRAKTLVECGHEHAGKVFFLLQNYSCLAHKSTAFCNALLSAIIHETGGPPQRGAGGGQKLKSPLVWSNVPVNCMPHYPLYGVGRGFDYCTVSMFCSLGVC